jgi:DNA-binding NtrC family response regulator
LPKILHAQLRHRQRCLELARHVRSLQDALKRATGGDAAAREGLENGGIDPATILKELATGRPEGVILVDDEGLVRYADRGACEIFGQRIDSMPLGTLAPSSGLEAFVRDVRTEPRVGFRFDLPARGSRGTRSLSAVAVPLLVRPGGPTNHVATRLLVLQDATRRRYAAERLKISDTVLNGRESSVLLDAARVLWRPEALPGRSAAVVAVRNTVVATAAQAAPVLITGPNGGEQDLVARIVHYTSPRTGPYISQRCGAMAPEHALAEVFGCAAPVARQGLLQHVVDGTLHLADIGELPQAVQERLANLLELLEAQTIALVPLESRREDIEDLARSLVVKHGAARGVTSLDGGALAILRARNWPNDVRELEDVVRSACNAASTPVITADELPRTMRDLGANGRSAVGRGVVTAPLPVSLPMATTGASGWGGTYARGELTPAPRASTGHRPARDWDITEDEPVSLDLYEKKALLRALDECGGDRLAAAKLLKVGKSTLYRKLKRFDIT